MRLIWKNRAAIPIANDREKIDKNRAPVAEILVVESRIVGDKNFGLAKIHDFLTILFHIKRRSALMLNTYHS